MKRDSDLELLASCLQGFYDGFTLIPRLIFRLLFFWVKWD